MALNIVLRQSRATLKRPPIPLQLARHYSTPISPTFPAVVRPFFSARLPTFNYLWYKAIYKGTVNDPTTFPTPSKSHGSYHWTFERLLSAGLVPLTAAAFVTSGSPAPLLDGLLGIGLIVHSHIGFDAILVDYVHKRKFPLLGPLLTWTLRLTSFAVGVGVYQFNTNDIGPSDGTHRRVWTA
ncbi:CybS-domain-containing protein [Lactifluus volemus]|nr:CybS-domain-containing protein [Lactifluus volemus]